MAAGTPKLRALPRRRPRQEDDRAPGQPVVQQAGAAIRRSADSDASEL